MTYPELYSDERVVLQAQNVKVKSVVFEVVLTTRRLVLIDKKKNSIPPQEINLATLKDVESGENAIRDPTITISIITISGNTRQMVLTFSKTSGGERRRECDDWVRALRQNITTTIYHPVTQSAAPKEAGPAPAAARPQVAESPVVQSPPPAARRIEGADSPPPKKRIEIARPMKKIVEAPPAMPVPVETTSLPTGSFCNRCGNRVPPESVFCNRCGTPVAQDAVPGSLTPEPVVEPVVEPLPQREVEVVPPPPASEVPQVQITSPPLPPVQADKKERPIEEVIHSIEPLIEDSVPRTAPAPLVPAKHAPPAESAGADQVPAESGSEFFDAPAKPPEVQWPVLTKTDSLGIAAPSEAVPAPAAAPAAAESLPPKPPRKTRVIMIAALAIVILAVIAGAFIFMQGQSGTPGTTPTPTVTTPAKTLPTTKATTIPTPVVPKTPPQVEKTPYIPIPQSGVWVKISYPDNYEGTVGLPGNVREVAASGEHFYQISTSVGPVVVSIQKTDGTSNLLSVDVYKDGELKKHAETTAPKGIVEFQAILKDDAPA